MDRRALFFLGAAALCALLSPVADPAHRWVALGLSGLYLVLAALSALDRYSRSQVGGRSGRVVPHPDAPGSATGGPRADLPAGVEPGTNRG